MAAAVRVIAVQGLSAPTALIAKEAGISNGSLFTYFPTKTDLLNQLYVGLKVEMAGTALADFPAKGDVKAQLHSVWSHWLVWTMTNPEKRRALTHLGVADEITAQSRQASRQAMAPVADLLERSRAVGPMRDMPLSFVVTLMSVLAEATIDTMLQDPNNNEHYAQAGFDAMWRMLN
ncbi:MAG: TetR/AcrR family transcriptional regulator [Azospirillaceae bacterium]|nr:TetR/AcrR family transcriptional regulator [Azospirillaceae bacterium]